MMRSRRSSNFLLILILLSSISFVIPVQCRESYYDIHFRLIKAYWGTDQLVEVSPGDVATLSVVLRYEKGWTFRNLKAVLSLPEGFEAVGGDSKSIAYYAGAISIGSVLKLEFPVFISPNVEKGSYKAKLRLEYYISKYVVPEEEVEVTFEVTGKPSIEVYAINNGLREGKQETWVILSNRGDAAAHNLEIKEAYSSTASVELRNATYIGDLKPGDNVAVSLSLFVPTGLSGKIVSLTVEGSYLGPTNVVYPFSETIKLPVKPSSLVLPLRLTLDTRELTIGKNSKMYVDLMNIGAHNLSDIRITLTPDNILKIFGPTKLYVDRLDPEENIRVETEVYVSATTAAPTASLTLTVTYFDEDLWTSQSETYKMSVLLRGFIDISLTDVAVIPSKPTPGGPFSITITVTNIGTSTAYATYAMPVIEGLPLSTFGPKSVYIGNIEVNLPTTFTINLQLGNTTETKITLPVTLSYMDNLRAAHNVTFNIPIDIGPRTGIQQSSVRSQRGLEILGLGMESILTIGILAIIAAVVLYIIVVRRR